MSPVKTKTQTIAQPTELTAAPVATLLQHSQDGLDTLNEADQHLQTAYAELAQETLPLDAESRRRHESLREEITVLKNATENYKKCYNTASAMTDELQTRLHDTERSQKKGIVPKPPANATIDFAERKQDHFAQGLNFYKLFLICFFGSFAGVIVELLWCLLRNGYLESRSVEYACSWGQEMIFGSCSWDYSSMPFNLNGRICLLYSIFWGALGVLWIKTLYPWIAKGILHIPNRIGKILTWLLFAFILFDAVMTVGAVFRWSQRIDGIAATNSLQLFFDVHFPDVRMERIFANMKFR